MTAARHGPRLTRVPKVCLEARARLPSRFGDFSVMAFSAEADDLEYGVIIKGEVDGCPDVPVRLHSSCFTGDLMGSLRCDCRDQLEAALEFIGEANQGVVIYLPQEGRGIGLINKIKAYALQEEGMDTVEANHALGLPDDLRHYGVAAEIIKALRIDSVVLLTNNPRKIQGLEEHGVAVANRIPLRIKPNRYNAFYLKTKQTKSGHLL